MALRPRTRPSTCPGVGKAVLNQQVTRITATGATMTVNMIVVTLSTAKFGLPAGTQIVVGHANSALAQTSIPNAGDAARIRVQRLVARRHSGHLGPGIPGWHVGNTNGKTLQNTAASTSIPGVLSSGTATNSVNGTLVDPTSTSVTTATIQNLNLLGGLISADGVKAEGNASITAGAVTTNETGSSFTNLVVNGQAMAAVIAPNTKISIGGLTVWLNRVIQSQGAITVRMIEITVNAANTQGLPIGSDIQVASAMAAGYPNAAG